MNNGHDYLGPVHTHQERLRPLPYDLERARRRRPGFVFLVGVIALIVLLAIVSMLPR